MYGLRRSNVPKVTYFLLQAFSLKIFCNTLLILIYNYSLVVENVFLSSVKESENWNPLFDGEGTHYNFILKHSMTFREVLNFLEIFGCVRNEGGVI